MRNLMQNSEMSEHHSGHYQIFIEYNVAFPRDELNDSKFMLVGDSLTQLDTFNDAPQCRGIALGILHSQSISYRFLF
jgi:hypothetical protein